MIKVMIVDDHPIVSDGLMRLVAEQEDMSVVGVAASGKECFTLLSLSVPDVLLLDIGLPDGSGIDLCECIVRKYPSLGVVALTCFGEYPYIEGMTRAGARGYVFKSDLSDEIAEAVRTVYAGDTYFSHSAAAALNCRPHDERLFLTGREKELLSLIAEGYTNREIAEKLFLGAETVKTYRKKPAFETRSEEYGIDGKNGRNAKTYLTGARTHGLERTSGRTQFTVLWLSGLLD